MKVCAHSERYRNLMAGIFENSVFFWQHRVSIVIGLIVSCCFVLFVVIVVLVFGRSGVIAVVTVSFESLSFSSSLASLSLSLSLVLWLLLSISPSMSSLPLWPSLVLCFLSESLWVSLSFMLFFRHIYLL